MESLIDLYDNFLIYNTNTFFILLFIFVCFLLIFSFFLSIKIFLLAIKTPKQISIISREVIGQIRNPLKEKHANINFPINFWIRNVAKVCIESSKKIKDIELFLDKIRKAIVKEMFIEE